MKKLILFFALVYFSVASASAQDSLILEDTRRLGALIADHLKLDWNEVKKHETELFYLLIKVRDSAYAGVEILSKEYAGNRKILGDKLPSILTPFKSASTKDKTIIFPLLIINSKRRNPEYEFAKKLTEHSDAFSVYSSGMVILLGIGSDRKKN